MIEWIFQNADKLSAFVLLLLGAVGAGLALHKEWIVMGKSHIRELALKDEFVAEVKKDCQFQREMNERLLNELERNLSVSEKFARVAVRKTDPVVTPNGGERRINLPNED